MLRINPDGGKKELGMGPAPGTFLGGTKSEEEPARKMFRVAREGRGGTASRPSLQGTVHLFPEESRAKFALQFVS